jgi:rRNA maturation RNase YbeY
MAITFSYADKRLHIRHKRPLKKFIESIFVSEQVALGKVSYVFCSDDYLLRINQQFLNHDYYTDIITFDLRNDPIDPVTGEIYISTERVMDNSKALKTTVSEEILRVMFHGALHLCGYKDKTKSEISRMREREDHYLRLYDLQLIKCST